jgi:hypothetical protein
MELARGGATDRAHVSFLAPTDSIVARNTSRGGVAAGTMAAGRPLAAIGTLLEPAAVGMEVARPSSAKWTNPQAFFGHRKNPPHRPLKGLRPRHPGSVKRCRAGCF